MRIAIISDIHANLEALEKAVELIGQHDVDEVVCLGDIVGYGASPNECIDLIGKTTPHVLLGNHDEAAVDLIGTEHFNPYARVAAEWTHESLTPEHREFLNKLPHTIELHGVSFVHSSPFEPQEWHYIISPADAQMNFGAFDTPICWFGHSHIPDLFCDDIWTREVVAGKKFLVNVGSVGQPRDNNWRLSFGIFDADTYTYKNVRAEYNAQQASDKIRAAGLPKGLADRILVGR